MREFAYGTDIIADGEAATQAEAEALAQADFEIKLRLRILLFNANKFLIDNNGDRSRGAEILRAISGALGG